MSFVEAVLAFVVADLIVIPTIKGTISGIIKVVKKKQE